LGRRILGRNRAYVQQENKKRRRDDQQSAHHIYAGVHESTSEGPQL
jgi:hypothetical protein